MAKGKWHDGGMIYPSFYICHFPIYPCTSGFLRRERPAAVAGASTPAVPADLGADRSDRYLAQAPVHKLSGTVDRPFWSLTPDMQNFGGIWRPRIQGIPGNYTTVRASGKPAPSPSGSRGPDSSRTELTATPWFRSIDEDWPRGAARVFRLRGTGGCQAGRTFDRGAASLPAAALPSSRSCRRE